MMSTTCRIHVIFTDADGLDLCRLNAIPRSAKSREILLAPIFHTPGPQPKLHPLHDLHHVPDFFPRRHQTTDQAIHESRLRYYTAPAHGQYLYSHGNLEERDRTGQSQDAVMNINDYIVSSMV